ncbi:MFS transporter [Maribacter sp. MMG018]|uniref:MFS transporter n=1 Tax=Maribacter sp. MMG018 TaxID=2822688 RepID=UPI001B377E5D|nr:MFS transporter [Maribacter sp. MMG018]MBQ4914565.1 MFS transporter [Maribacter sp. MMG018]
MAIKPKGNTLTLNALAFGNFAAGISSLIVAGISTEMATGLDVTVGQIGLLVTVFALSYAIGAPLFSALRGKTDCRTVLIIGMLTVLVGIASNYTIVLIGRVISAIGSAVFVPLAALVGISIARLEEQGRISAIVFTGVAVATAIGVPFGTFIGINFGWLFSFMAVY